MDVDLVPVVGLITQHVKHLCANCNLTCSPFATEIAIQKTLKLGEPSIHALHKGVQDRKVLPADAGVRGLGGGEGEGMKDRLSKVITHAKECVGI